MLQFKGMDIFNIIAPFTTKVDDSAFYEFMQLRYLYAPNLSHVGKAAFYYCLALFQVDAKLEIIDDRAFHVCISLAKLDVSKVESLGADAFKMCDALQQFINNKITSLNLACFADCKSMRLFDVASAEQTFGSVQFRQSIQIRLPKCKDAQFFSEKQLFLSEDTSSPKQHEKVKTLYKQPLIYNAKSCAKQQIQWNMIVENEFLIRGLVINIKQIPEKQFQRCCLLFVYAKNLLEVQKQAFDASYCLRRFTAPQLQKIDEKAFFGCVSLTEITTQNVISLSPGAFCYCQSLVKLDFKKLERFDLSVIQNCSSLLQVTGNFQKQALAKAKVSTKSEQKRFQEALIDEFRERRALQSQVSRVKMQVVLLKGLKMFAEK
uniref:Leucine rich repeats-containing protein n=1 Tax=Trepomonas sp. PC1 TaxID=1076344 RepID=A0A146K843_9EUKA|eukprot:JAP92787.1 Leucine rich repeats-containing protein [Trepomonas sp. PC1]